MKLIGAGLRCFLVVAAIVSLSACITTEERLFSNEASQEKALKSRLQLARSYIGQQNWQDAKRNLEQAAEIDPDAPEVHEAFALVYQSTGEYELAEESFKIAIKLNKDFSRARNNYAAFLYQQERYSEAEEQLEIVVQDTLYESRPRAYLNLGLCRLRLGNPDGAHEAFTRTLTMDRTNIVAIMELAHIDYDRGNYAASQRQYDLYRTLVRSQSARGLWLGVRLAHARNNSNAKASYALALRNIYPQSAEFRAYRQAVERGEL